MEVSEGETEEPDVVVVAIKLTEVEVIELIGAGRFRKPCKSGLFKADAELSVVETKTDSVEDVKEMVAVTILEESRSDVEIFSIDVLETSDNVLISEVD